MADEVGQEEEEQQEQSGVAERLGAAVNRYNAGLYMEVDESLPQDEQSSPPSYISKAAVAAEYGLNEQQLARGLKNVSKGKPAHGGKGGRRPLLSAESVQILAQGTDDRDMSRISKDRMGLWNFLDDHRKGVADEQGQNALAVTPMSLSSFKKYADVVAPERVKKPSRQSERRYEALMTPTNHMSMAAMWPAITMAPNPEGEWERDPHLLDEAIVNFDNTALLLRSPEKDENMLYCAMGTVAKLKELRLSPAFTTDRTDDNYKMRCVHVTVATTPAGNLNCAIIKIKDKRFRDFGKVLTKKLTDSVHLGYPVYLQAIPWHEPGVRPVAAEEHKEEGKGPADGEEKEGIFEDVDRDMDETTFEAEQLRQNESSGSAEGTEGAQVPNPPAQSLRSVAEQQSADYVVRAVTRSSLDALRVKVEKRLNQVKRAALVYHDPDSLDSDRAAAFSAYEEQVASGPEIDAAMQKHRVVISFDGEQFQIRAMGKMRTSSWNEEVEGMEFMKFAASCSFIFQPCDVQSCFRTLKCKTRKATGQSSERYSIPDYMEDQFLLKVLGALDAASRRTYRDFLVQFPSLMAESFCPTSVKEGWRSPGLVPYSPERMMARWPGWSKVSTLNARAALECIPDLSVKGRKGFLTPHEILEVVGPYLGELKTFAIPTDKELEDLQVNRWLTVWLNAEGTIERIQANEDFRRMRAEEAAAEREVREARKAANELEKERRESTREGIEATRAHLTAAAPRGSGGVGGSSNSSSSSGAGGGAGGSSGRTGGAALSIDTSFYT
ncbi:hypothetical protein B484DRAFT_397545 [Ochromonadaceae sp. CCMP2298]|nr:hypothetical protein B484DRAFT_397545 [Ochromonadaceae sp. CCMP2298]